MDWDPPAHCAFNQAGVLGPPGKVPWGLEGEDGVGALMVILFLGPRWTGCGPRWTEVQARPGLWS